METRAIPKIHTLRETDDDKKKEKRILDGLAKHFGVTAQQVLTHGKYKIDGVFYLNNRVHAFVECKWLTKEGFYGLNVPKYIEGCTLSAWTKVPFIYAFRVPKKLGYIVVHDGNWAAGNDELKHTGGIRNPPNWDDIEPMMMLDKDRIKWVPQ